MTPEEYRSVKTILEKADGTYEDLYVRMNLDGSFTVIDESGTVYNTTPDAQYFEKDTVVYDVYYDSDSEEVKVVEHVDSVQL